jgi:hypothetical protein
LLLITFYSNDTKFALAKIQKAHKLRHKTVRDLSLQMPTTPKITENPIFFGPYNNKASLSRPYGC